MFNPSPESDHPKFEESAWQEKTAVSPSEHPEAERIPERIPKIQVGETLIVSTASGSAYRFLKQQDGWILTSLPKKVKEDEMLKIGGKVELRAQLIGEFGPDTVGARPIVRDEDELMTMTTKLVIGTSERPALIVTSPIDSFGIEKTEPGSEVTFVE